MRTIEHSSSRKFDTQRALLQLLRARNSSARSRDRLMNHTGWDIYREMKVPSFRFLVTRFIYLDIYLWWEFDSFLIYGKKKKKHGVVVCCCSPPGDAWSRLATMVNLLEKLNYSRMILIQAKDAEGREDGE